MAGALDRDGRVAPAQADKKAPSPPYVRLFSTDEDLEEFAREWALKLTVQLRSPELSDAEATDLVQTVLVKVLSDRGTDGARGVVDGAEWWKTEMFGRWIGRICENARIDYLKDKTKRRRREAPIEDETGRVVIELKARGASAEEMYESTEVRKAMRNCMKKLNPIEIEVLRYRYRDGLGCTEIGIKLWPSNTVIAAERRARRVLMGAPPKLGALEKLQKCLKRKGIQVSCPMPELGEFSIAPGDWKTNGKHRSAKAKGTAKGVKV